jgi:hypothetical protein
MSYHVHYEGDLSVTPPLNPAEQKALAAFHKSRRIWTKAGPLDTRDLSSGHEDVIDYNKTAPGQPGLWCDVTPLGDAAKLGVDSSRENSDITPWVEYLIDHLLKPGAVFATFDEDFPDQVGSKDLLRGFTFDHVVNGEMKAVGEDGETWLIKVKDNVVKTVKATFPEDEGE